MSGGEMTYLMGVIAALGCFAMVLAWAQQRTN
jgi:hypothetical protein